MSFENTVSTLTPAAFQKIVLRWFDHFGRKDLPWQDNKTPYRVWVSEIMLQQTQVTTVIPYFARFLKRFPTLKALAEAQEDEVLHLWTGLGYYNRARNLHRSARLIQTDYQGQFPNTLEAVQKLPGIGRSTAGAIISCAFNQRAAILDGNVKRLLSRFMGLRDPIDAPHTLKQLWDFAETYTPIKRVGDYSQVMMDLGATLCTQKKPRCAECPLQKACQGYQEGIAEQLPIKKKRASLPVRETLFLVLQYKEYILLEKRPSSGLWGGLWSLPELPKTSPLKAIKQFCLDHYQLPVKKQTTLPSFRHTFSHFHLDIYPVHFELHQAPSGPLAKQKTLWYSLKQPKAIGLPAPILTLLGNFS